MSAGRGMPRVAPGREAPPRSTAFDDSTTIVVPEGTWSFERAVNGDDVPLSDAAFAALILGNIAMPLGAVRGSLLGIYTPAATGGRPLIRLRWSASVLGGGVSASAFRVIDVANTTYGDAVDPVIADAPAFGDAFLLPPSPDDSTPIPFILPFWVPSLPQTTKQIGLNVTAREAGGVAAGSLQLVYMVADNFGQPEPIARL